MQNCLSYSADKLSQLIKKVSPIIQSLFCQVIVISSASWVDILILCQATLMCLIKVELSSCDEKQAQML